jgi:hypothetical protein
LVLPELLVPLLPQAAMNIAAAAMPTTGANFIVRDLLI